MMAGVRKSTHTRPFSRKTWVAGCFTGSFPLPVTKRTSPDNYHALNEARKKTQPVTTSMENHPLASMVLDPPLKQTK